MMKDVRAQNALLTNPFTASALYLSPDKQVIGPMMHNLLRVPWADFDSIYKAGALHCT
jgi:hypothetical protein